MCCQLLSSLQLAPIIMVWQLRTATQHRSPTMTATKASSKRKANSGSFQPGPDPRRHILSKAEQRKGFEMAQRSPQGRRFHAWLWRKVSRFYAGKPCRKQAVLGIEALERLEQSRREQESERPF